MAVITLSRKQIRSLDLEGAFDAEISATRNLVPEEPWYGGLAEHKADYLGLLKTRLRAGLVLHPAPIVLARKAGLGTRPIPFLAIDERVVYRALAERLLRNAPSFDRSFQAFEDFLTGPLYYAKSLSDSPGSWILRMSEVSHVLKTDISSFYDFIDHSVLMDELLDVADDYELIQALMALIRGVAGREFGVPQLYDASDWLSEVYGDILERAMQRRGYATWRFNDDFRVAVQSYPEALEAIEYLSRVARDIGLAISEHKTFTPTFLTYALSTMSLTADESLPPRDQAEMEDAVVLYATDDPVGQVADAVAVVEHVHDSRQGPPGGPDAIELDNLHSSQLGELRRMFHVLAREANPAALDIVVPCFVYAPVTTPYLVDYLVTLEADQAATAIQTVVQYVSLGEWQSLWLIAAIGRLDVLHEADEYPSICAWLKERLAGRSPAVKAHAAYWLAAAGEIDLDQLEILLQSEPESFQIAYGAAIDQLNAGGPGVG